MTCARCGVPADVTYVSRDGKIHLCEQHEREHSEGLKRANYVRED